MKHRKRRIKPNMIWNKFICPIINFIGYLILSLFPFAFIIGVGILAELICS